MAGILRNTAAACLLALLPLVWAEDATDTPLAVEATIPDGNLTLTNNPEFFKHMDVKISYLGESTVLFSTRQWISGIERITYQASTNRVLQAPMPGACPSTDLYFSPYDWNFTDPSIVRGATIHYYVTMYLNNNNHRPFHSKPFQYYIVQ